MKKKLLSLIVAAIMVLSMLPMGAMAEAAQKALNEIRTETTVRTDEGVKTPEAIKASEAPSYRDITLSEAMNAADTDFFIDFVSDGDWTEGTYPWQMVQEGERAYGICGNSRIPGSSSTVSASFTLDTAYTLSFDYMAWGEGELTAWDKCIFRLDGTLIFEKGAEQNNWTNYTVEDVLFAGEHTIEFTYSKDTSVDPTGDYFLVDEVKLTVAADVTPTPAPTPVPEDYFGCFFETQAEVDTWRLVDNDGDGHNWTWGTSKPAYEGLRSMYSESYSNSVGALTPDNFLISPVIFVSSAESFVSLYLGAGSPSFYAEHVAIYIATSQSTAYDLLDEFTCTSYGYERYEYSLADYVGQNVQLMIRHFDCNNQYWLSLDQVEFFGVKEPTPIDTIEIMDFVEPVWGEHPFFDVTVPDDANYSINRVEWRWYIPGTNGYALLQETDTFDNEEARYFMFLHIDPDDGYTFSNDAAVTINGDTAFVDFENNWFTHSGTVYVLSVKFTVEPVNVIPEIAIEGFVEPTWGAAPSYDLTLPDDANYSINLAKWRYYIPGSSIQDAEIFDNEEARYYMRIDVIPDEGYTFSDDTVVTINGHSDIIEELYWDEYERIFYVLTIDFTVTAPTMIDEIAIEGFVEPAWGELPGYDLTLPDDANYSINLAKWRYYIPGSSIQDADIFDNEEARYYMRIDVIPDEGYTFSDDTVVTINGHSDIIEELYWDEYERIFYVLTIDFTVTAPTMIDEIAIEGFVEPAGGENPFFDVTVPDDANYAVHFAEWCWYNPDLDNHGFMQPTDTFDSEEVSYYMFLTIYPNDGYAFSNDTAVTINGDTVLFDSENSFWHEELGCFYVYSIGFHVEVPAPEIIDEITVEGFVEPTWGANPCFDLTLPDDANYSIAFTVWHWYTEEDYGFMQEADIFDSEEAHYYVHLELIPDEGYTFSNDTAVTINGDTAIIEELHWDAAERIFYVLTIHFTVEREPEVIDTIEILDFVEPVWGENPFLGVTVPDDAPYTIDRIFWNWYTDDDGDTMSPSDVFDNREYAYYQYLEIVPAEGYVFADEVTVTINGAASFFGFGGWSDEDGCFYIYTIDFFVTDPDAPIGIWGDADGDGVLSTADALLLMRHVLGSDTVADENLDWCDVNGDGSVDLEDALFIMRRTMGMIGSFPVEE